MTQTKKSPTPPPPPAPVPRRTEAHLPHLSCPHCQQTFTWPQDDRSLIQDPSRLVCRTRGCVNHDIMFKSPIVVLFEIL